MPSIDSTTLHATAVGFANGALLLLGKSGSGKSSVAVQLMAFGASLISDDQVHLKLYDDSVRVLPPKGALELIELRGIGLVRCELMRSAPCLRAIVNLDPTYRVQRLPDPDSQTFLGKDIPCVHLNFQPDLGSRLFLWLKALNASA